MREFSLYLFLFVIIIPIVQAYKNPDKTYQLPFLYSFAVLIYIIPTLLGVVSENSKALSDSQFIRYNFLSIACFLSAVIGYNSFNLKNNNPPLIYYNENKMSQILFFFIVIASISVYILGGFDVENRSGGLYAIILYPARCLRPATVMLFILYIIKPSKDKLFFLIMSFLISAKIILIDGRRSEVFNLFITIAFPLFIVKAKAIPRYTIIPALVGSMAVFILLPAIREHTLKGEFSSAFTISPVQLFTDYMNAEKANEVVHAAKNVEVVALQGDYNYGITFYNSFIYQYVSRTLFGEGVKESLMLSSPINLEELRERNSENNDDVFRFYLAPTGFAGAFFEFGYGAIALFFLFGIISKYFYLKAIARNSLTSCMFYCFFATFILFSIYDSMISIPVMIVLYLVVFEITKKYSKIKIQ